MKDKKNPDYRYNICNGNSGEQRHSIFNGILKYFKYLIERSICLDEFQFL